MGEDGSGIGETYMAMHVQTHAYRKGEPLEGLVEGGIPDIELRSYL